MVVISFSPLLYGLQVFLYLGFWGAVCGLVFPFAQQDARWLMLPVSVGLILLWAWKQYSPRRMVKRLWADQGKWFLSSMGITQTLVLSGEVLVWPWVVILTLNADSNKAKSLYLVIMSDAVTDADFRRLSCWLRVCLKPKH